MSALTELGNAALQTRFRSLFRQVPAAVAIITTWAADGEPRGATVSSLVSLSLDPLLLSVCLVNRSRTLQALRGCGCFAVNLLGSDDLGLADAFSRNKAPGSRFAGVAYRTVNGTPVLDAAWGWLTCGVANVLPAGDHRIVIGSVRELHEGPGSSLIHYGGRYLSLEPTASAGG